MIEEINVNGYDAEVVVQPRIDLDYKVIEFKLTNAAVGGLEISKLVSENRGNAIVSLILKSNWMNLSMVCIDQ